MLPEKLCQTEKMAPGTVAIGNMAKWVAASEVASPEFCIHLQRLEVETMCAVVLTCDGDVLDEERWGAGVVEQVSLAMKLEFPDADGFSMYYTQGGEENTMFFRIGSKKRFFFADYASFGGHYVWGFRRLMVYYVGFYPTFSRHAKADASIVLVIWLNENVVFVSAKGNSKGCLRLGWSCKPNDVERVWRYVKLNFVVLWGE